MGGVPSLLSALFGGGGKQKYTPAPAPSAPTPTASPDTAAGAETARRLSGVNAGLQSTIKTSASGAPDSGTTAYKSLLGE